MPSAPYTNSFRISIPRAMLINPVRTPTNPARAQITAKSALRFLSPYPAGDRPSRTISF
jgi:hypothetical protein